MIHALVGFDTHIRMFAGYFTFPYWIFFLFHEFFYKSSTKLLPQSKDVALLFLKLSGYKSRDRTVVTVVRRVGCKGIICRIRQTAGQVHKFRVCLYL